jgi:hypothetical protein
MRASLLAGVKNFASERLGLARDLVVSGLSGLGWLVNFSTPADVVVQPDGVDSD